MKSTRDYIRLAGRPERRINNTLEALASEGIA
jgi:hypothetical protein